MGGQSNSPAKLAALAELRSRRKIATTPIAPPPGWASAEALLYNTREFCGRHSGMTMELSRYLRVNESSVRRWLKGEKMPRQETVDKIGAWRRIKEAGL